MNRSADPKVIEKWDVRWDSIAVLTDELVLHRRQSSTQRAKMVNSDAFSRKYTHGSAELLMKPKLVRKESKVKFHSRDDCLRP